MNETEGEEASRATTSQVPLRQLAWLFLKLGAIAFGGPAAHINSAWLVFGGAITGLLLHGRV